MTHENLAGPKSYCAAEVSLKFTKCLYSKIPSA